MQIPEEIAAHSWQDQIPPEQWQIYRQVIELIHHEHLPVLLGGGFALAAYTDRWRNTRDLDLYMQPECARLLAERLLTHGFADYYQREPYDRSWIFRSSRDGVMIDLIWGSPGTISTVTAEWIESAATLWLRGLPCRIITCEDLIWAKLYVMQRLRCDWPDLVNVLYRRSERLDWGYLQRRIGADRDLLLAMLALFRWIAPGRAQHIPRELLTLEDTNRCFFAQIPEYLPERVSRLESRPWFVENEITEIGLREPAGTSSAVSPLNLTPQRGA